MQNNSKLNKILITISKVIKRIIRVIPRLKEIIIRAISSLTRKIMIKIITSKEILEMTIKIINIRIIRVINRIIGKITEIKREIGRITEIKGNFST